MSFEQCRDDAAGKSSAEGSKLLPGTTIFLGPFLPLSVTPHGQTQFASSVLSCSELLIRRSLGDFSMASGSSAARFFSSSIFSDFP
jgi:hypothetical protein